MVEERERKRERNREREREEGETEDSDRGWSARVRRHAGRYFDFRSMRPRGDRTGSGGLVDAGCAPLDSSSTIEQRAEEEENTKIRPKRVIK